MPHLSNLRKCPRTISRLRRNWNAYKSGYRRHFSVNQQLGACAAEGTRLPGTDQSRTGRSSASPSATPQNASNSNALKVGMTVAPGRPLAPWLSYARKCVLEAPPLAQTTRKWGILTSATRQYRFATSTGSAAGCGPNPVEKGNGVTFRVDNTNRRKGDQRATPCRRIGN